MLIPEPHISPAEKPFCLPLWSRLHLPSGIPVYFVQDNSQEILTVSLVCSAGATGEAHAGVASMTGALLQRGTRKRSGPAIADAVDALGAVFRTAGNRDNTVLTMTGLAEHYRAMLEVLCECACEPSFDNDEFERLRIQHVSDYDLSLAYPDYCASRAFTAMMFNNHPYAQPVAGTKADMLALTSQDCRTHHDSMLSLHAWYAVVAGKFHHDDIMIELEKGLGSYIKQVTPAVSTYTLHSLQGLTTGYAGVDSAKQAVFQIGQRSIDRKNPDFAALTILNTLFGEYFLSRLNSVLREQKGYTYGVHSSIHDRRHAAVMSASASVRSENLAESIDIVMHEWSRLRNEPVSADEFETCRRYLRGIFSLSIETPQQVAGFLMSAHEHDQTPEDYERFVDRLSSLRLAELHDAQQRVIDDKNLVIAAAGKDDEVIAAMQDFVPLRHIVL